MTLALDARAPAVGQGAIWPKVAFVLSAGLVLTFSQFWVMPLSGPNGDPEASTLIRAVYFPAYAAALVLLVAGWRAAVRVSVRAPLLWALMVMIGLSVLWSIDPGVTQRRGIAVLFTTLAGVAIAARYDWPKMLEVFATAFAVTVLVSFFLGIALPSYGRMQTIFPGAWRGAWFEKNALGDFMTEGFMVFAAAGILNPRRRWVWAGFAAAALALVLLSTSKTSLITLMIGASAMGFVGLVRRGPASAVVATFLAVVALGALAFTIVFAADALFALLGKDATLTGRTKIWAAVLRQIHTRPWTGFGYAAVWDDDSGWGPLAWITKQAGFRAHHAHNSWLEAWLGLGLVGLGVWVAYFAETWGRTLVAVYRSPAAWFALPFMAAFSLTTLTESVAFIYNDFLWTFFVAIGLRLAAPVALARP